MASDRVGTMHAAWSLGLSAILPLLLGLWTAVASAAGDAVDISGQSDNLPEDTGQAVTILAAVPATETGALVLVQDEPVVEQVHTGRVNPEEDKPFLSLAEAVSLALASSPGLNALDWQAQAFWEQAESVLGRQRLSSSFSILGLQTTAPLGVFAAKLSQGSVTQADFDPARLNDPDPYGNIEYQLRLVYPLFTADRIDLIASALRLSAEASSLDRLRAEHELEARVIETYLAHDLLEEQLLVLADARETVDALTRTITSLHREGLVIGADLAAAEVETAKLDDELNRARSQLAMTENIVSILTGQAPGFSSEIALDAVGAQAPELEELYSVALERRPDLRAMERRVSAAQNMFDEASRKRRPEIGAFAEGKHATADLPGNGHTEVTVGAQLSIDLDTGGVIRNEVQQKKAERNSATKALEQLQLQARIEVAAAHAELSAALGSQLSLRTQSARAAENLRVVRNRYREGLTNYLDVRMAISGHKESRLRELQADYDAALAYMKLLSATGQIGSSDDPFLGAPPLPPEMADEAGSAAAKADAATHLAGAEDMGGGHTHE